METLTTNRLTLSELSYDDTDFIIELLNDPDWIKYIGDRGIHNIDDAKRYLDKGPIASYQQHGFGLYKVTLKENANKIGMCGLLKRDYLNHPDLGFAFLPAYRNSGYAYEAAMASLQHAKNQLNLSHILAATSLENEASSKLLEKLGFKLEKIAKLCEEYDESKLYSIEL